MAFTYKPIATSTLISTSNTITFSNVPQTYTDLKLILVGKATAVSKFFGVTFNSDDATGNMNSRSLITNGSTTTSSGLNDNSYGGGLFYSAEMAASQNSLIIVDIFNYTSSFYKTFLGSYSGDQNGTNNIMSVAVGTWANTAAITQVRARLGTTGLFSAGTTATLYGIKAA